MVRTTALLCVALVFSTCTSAQENQARDGKPLVKMTTTLGDMYVQLYADKAPGTVKNFLGYVESGHYEGTIFHRVISDFMAQGGGFLPDYTKKETSQPPIQNEADNGLKNEYATLAMARTGDPHSATAQFFINCSDNDFLNHTDKTQRGWGYCVFGKVIAGTDTLEKIRAAKVKFDPKADARSPARPVEPIVIKKVVSISPSDPGLAAARKDEDARAAKAAEEMKVAAEYAKKVKTQAMALVKDEQQGTKTDSGLRYLDVTVGKGESPEADSRVTVHYTGWLVDGKKFDSSRDRGRPIDFGLNQVIKGWSEGVASMKVGGKRILVIPPELGYGDREIGGGLIPANSTLLFEVELVAIDQ